MNRKDPKVATDIMEYCMTHITMLRLSSTHSISWEQQLLALDFIIEHQKGSIEKGMVDCLATYSEIIKHLAFFINEPSIAIGFHRFVGICPAVRRSSQGGIIWL
jgi:hypothetical protein